jgi:hypothetical protein
MSQLGLSIASPSLDQKWHTEQLGKPFWKGSDGQNPIGHETAHTDSLAVSSNGTTHKNVGYEARHVNMLVPIHESEEVHVVKHQSHLVGIDSATDHSSQTQADGWKSKLQETLDVYSQSPLAKHSQGTPRLADFFACLQGMNGGHAKDQKKLAELLKINQALMQKSLGEDRLLELSIPEIVAFLTKANNQKIEKVGGPLKWSALSSAEKLVADAETMSAVVLKFGSPTS